jgi:dihydroceramide fatty acyl 2-hydroxylase
MSVSRTDQLKASPPMFASPFLDRFTRVHPAMPVLIYVPAPNDPLRLVMPPTASVPLALAFYAVFRLTLGARHAPGFDAGFLACYLAYDMLHFHVHHHKPRTRIGHWLRELHMRHHFQDHERGFGVSAPYWDCVFGTAAQRRS